MENSTEGPRQMVEAPPQEAFGRVCCGCGFQQVIGDRALPPVLITRAESVAVGHLRESPECGRYGPWLEVMWTMRLPTRGYLREPATEREMRSLLRGDPCSYCGGPAQHLDHIVPRVRGGDDGHINRTSSCARCNCAKGRQSLLGFLAHAGVGR